MSAHKFWLPTGYVPFARVDLCSNTLVGVPVWFSVGGNIPIAIGKGTQGPRVWLRAPIRSLGDWRELIRDNEVVNSDFPNVGSVLFSHDQAIGQTSVDIGGIPVLRCSPINDVALVVKFLDLQPLHLNIRGSQGGLRVANAHYSLNHFEGIAVLFGSELTGVRDQAAQNVGPVAENGS